MSHNKEALADQLRDFADRVEDGEVAIVEIQTRIEPLRVTLEGMQKDDLERLHTYFE
jgi:hypothetical protein